MAKYSVIVLFVSSYIVLGLGYGATNLKVTTNPIEIWASPDSRSRLEKDYFDTHFKPFYRTEQIFIKAVNVPNVSCVQISTISYNAASLGSILNCSRGSNLGTSFQQNIFVGRFRTPTRN